MNPDKSIVDTAPTALETSTAAPAPLRDNLNALNLQKPSASQPVKTAPDFDDINAAAFPASPATLDTPDPTSGESIPDGRIPPEGSPGALRIQNDLSTRKVEDSAFIKSQTSLSDADIARMAAEEEAEKRKEAESFKPSNTPAIPGLVAGRIVQFQIAPGRTLAAVLVEVLDPYMGDAVLTVFGNLEVDHFLTRQLTARFDTQFITSRQKSEGMWHFPSMRTL